MKALLILFLGFSLNASEKLESKTLGLALEKAKAMKQIYGKEVLVALDLDNTLLKTDQNLGGEEWWEWQTKLVGTKDPLRVGCKFGDLLEQELRILDWSHMSPTESDAATTIQQIQDLGVYTVILTSRGPDNVSHTLRELSRNKMDFSRKALPPSEGFASSYLPFEAQSPGEAGLSDEEIGKFKLLPHRPVAYQSGVFFVSGQHKGEMLKTLLKKTKTTIKGIVYVDNLSRQTEKVWEAFFGSKIDLVDIRYSGTDPIFEKFDKDNKKAVTASYKKFHKVLSEVFRYEKPCSLPVDK